MRCWTPRAEGGAGTSRAGPGEEGRSALAREGSACEDSAREVPAPPSARGAVGRGLCAASPPDTRSIRGRWTTSALSSLVRRPEACHVHTPPTTTARAITPRTAPSIHINLPRVRMSATLHSRQVRFSFPVIVSIKPSSSIPREGCNSLRPRHARHRSSCASASRSVCPDSTYHWTKSRNVQVCGMSVFPCAAR